MMMSVRHLIEECLCVVCVCGVHCHVNTDDGFNHTHLLI